MRARAVGVRVRVFLYVHFTTSLYKWANFLKIMKVCTFHLFLLLTRFFPKLSR